MARRGFNGALMRAFTKDHAATVREVEYLAPHFVRLRFHSDALLDDVVLAPAVWLRFWFPGIDEPTTEHQRAYTITEADPETGNFAIDCVLHEPAGPASAWAARAESGDEIAVMSLGPSKFTVPAETPEGYLLIGDAAALPGISSVINALPPDIAIEVYLEQHHPNDPDIPFPERSRMNVHWVPRVDDTSLAAAIEDRDWSNWYAWVTPESASLKHLRVRLRDDFGFPKSEMYPQAYWVEGKAMGTSRTEEAATPEEAAAPNRPTPADQPTQQRTGHKQWKAGAGNRLLAPLKSTFIAAGVLQALVTLLELAPFVLLVELARRLLTGAGGLWALGITAVILLGAGAVVASAMMVWLHRVDAGFARQTRQRLLGKLARLPLGWFTARSAGQIKKQVQDDTLELHYLVTHAVLDAVAAAVAPIAVLVYLFRRRLAAWSGSVHPRPGLHRHDVRDGRAVSRPDRTEPAVDRVAGH